MNAVQTAVITPAVALMGWGGKPWAYPPSEKCLKLQREVPNWTAVPLFDAMRRRHSEDTWFQAITATDRRTWPRFRKALLLDKASQNSAQLTYAVLDLDLPEHRKRPWTSRDAAEDALLEAIEQMNAHGWPHAWGYATRGGLRIGWLLDMPLPLVHAQSFMDQLHAAVPKNLPVPLDEEVVDWTRGYRLPWCPRADGKTFAWGEDAPPMALDALREGRTLDWRPATLTDETIPPPRTVSWPERRRDETPLDKRIRPCVERWAQEIAESSSRHGVLLRKARTLGGLCQAALDRGQYANPEPWAEILIAAASDSNDAEAAVWDAIEYGAASPWWFEEKERTANRRGPDLRVIPPMENGNTQPDAYAADEDAHNGGDIDGDADLPPELDERCLDLPYTDLGNARRFALQFGADARWCQAKDGWLLWQRSHWGWDERMGALGFAHQTVDRVRYEAQRWQQRRDDEGDPDKRMKLDKRAKDAYKHYMCSQASGRIKAITEQAKGLPGIPVSTDDFDTNPWLLTVENGTIELRTQTCREHRRDDLINRVAPVVYDPAATCPRWDKFIVEVFPDAEVRSFVQRAIGYSLTGDIGEQLWFLLQGEGSNGKSTLLEVIGALLGEYATSLPQGFLESRDFDPHPTESTGLYRARFAAGTEPRKKKAWDAEKIKRQTGGDIIEARFMHGDFFYFHPTHKLWIACNDMPKTDDMGTGFWRRVVIIPFTQRWYREDEQGTPKLNADLPLALKKELSGILNWAIKGLKDKLDGGLRVPPACRLAVNAYREEQDEVGRFLTERCEVTSATTGISPGSTLTSALYSAYRKWRDGEGLDGRPLSNVQFGKQLTARKLTATESGGRTKRSGVILRDIDFDGGDGGDE